MSPAFVHKRGLRQGDPLSPYLFIIAADVLQQMTKAASVRIPHHLSPRLPMPIITFQYADDTILFVSAKGQTLRLLLLVTHCFAASSGLKINLHKSSFVPISIPQQFIPHLETLLGCPSQDLPITYLGMPLSLKAPTKHHFMPLVQKLEMKLAGWKSRFISRAGKLQLVKSVLSAVSTYYMSCFHFPQWLINRIDAIRRNFLWNRSEGRSPVHLLHWRKVCLPVTNGGLGVLDLMLQNTSLLLRWWWRLYAEGNILWKTYASMIYALRPSHDGPLLLSRRGSFFWKYIHRLKPLFFSCAQFELNSGKRVSFWQDGWVGQPLAHEHCRPSIHRNITVHDAKLLWPNLLPAPLTFHHHLAVRKLADFVPTAHDDHLRWLLSPSGNFSARSVYFVLSQGGKTKSTITSLWKAKVTPSMKLFCFFLLSNRLLTHENMQKRHLSFQPGCVLCNQAHETTMHLFFQCHFSHQIWLALSSLPGHPALTIEDSPLLTYTSSIPAAPALRPPWLVTFITATWLIWRERNNRTFRQATTPAPTLLANIRHEAALCLKYC